MKKKNKNIIPNENKFSDRFHNLRKLLRLSQNQLSEILGLKGNTQISKFENGSSEPSLELLRKIANLSNINIQVDLHELITGSPSPLVNRLKTEYYDILELAAKYISSETTRLLEKRHNLWGELGVAQEKLSKGIIGQAEYVDFLKKELNRIEELISNITEDRHYVDIALTDRRQIDI